MKLSRFQKILNRLPLSKRHKGRRKLLYLVRDFNKAPITKTNKVTIISQERVELDKINTFGYFEVINN
jgi:hypothetical protein